MLISIGQAAHARDLGFIEFGSGDGRSAAFAMSLGDGNGLCVDLSPDAVETCLAKGLTALQGDLLSFSDKNVAKVAVAIDLLPELPGRKAVEIGFVNLVRSARNYAVIQHAFFDLDAELASGGALIPDNFSSRVLYKPTLADYLYFLNRYVGPLNIAGMAAFGLGSVVPSPLPYSGHSDLPKSVFRSIRIIIARRDPARFRAALDKAATGTALFVWEKAD